MRIILKGIWQTWVRFWYVFHASHRVEDLQRLIKWAERKRLRGVRDSYRYRLLREAISLKGCKAYYPTTVSWARGFYKLVRLMTPEPRYYRAGMTYKAC